MPSDKLLTKGHAPTHTCLPTFTIIAVLVLLLGVMGRALADEVTWLDVKLSLPAAAADLVPTQLIVDLDGQDVAVVPATLPLSPARDDDPHILTLRTLSGSQAFVFQLAVDQKGVHVLKAETTACDSVHVAGTVARQGARQVLLVSFSGVAAQAQACTRGKRAVGPPSGRFKVRFTTSPTGATLLYPEEQGLLLKTYDYVAVGKTPVVRVIDFRHATRISVVFKLPGHADCIKAFTLDEDKEGKKLVIDKQAQLIAASVKDDDAVVVSCTLLPIPAGK